MDHALESEKEGGRTMERNKKTACYCETYRCDGKFQSTRTARNHRKMDNSQKAFEPVGPEFDPAIYEKLSASKTPLYKNARLTILEAIYDILRKFVFTPNGAKASISKQLNQLKERFLPENNTMPKDFDAALKIIRPLLISLERYHVCPNDCIIFRKEYAHETQCPICNADRYKSDGKTANRNFTYFPIAPRIRRMIATKNIRDLLTQGGERSDVMTDIQHSKEWQNWFAPGGEFDGRDYGIALNICLDGVNPFKSNKVDYSFWPIILSVLNFPPRLRKTLAGMLICGIIPGNGTKEPKTLEPYIALLVDELISLEHCKMSDGDGTLVNVSVKLLQFTLDFPAIGKVLHLPGSARSFRACPFCTIVGQNCKSCNKTVFLGHRRYLETTDRLRMTTQNQVNDEVEERSEPKMNRTRAKTRELRIEYSQMNVENRRKKFTLEHGVKGVYEFMRLKYHGFQEHIGPDPMHTVKDLLENIAKIMNGSFSLEKLKASEIEFKGDNFSDDVLSIVLKESEKQRVNDRIDKLIFPSTATGCKKSFLTKTSHVQPTHAWHEYGAKNIMIYLLRDCMAPRVRRTLIYWLSILNRVESYKIDIHEIESIDRDLKIAAALSERDLPVCLQLITTHMVLHEGETLRTKGPAHSRWMYCFERLNSVITRRVMNRKTPEACVIRTIQLLDWVVDVTLAQRLPIVKHIDPSNSLEELISSRTGNEKVRGKRKREQILSTSEQFQIEGLLGKCQLENCYVTEKSEYKTDIDDDIGVVTYQSRSNIRSNDFRKSSRFVYVNDKRLFAEIVAIYEHLEGETEFTWFVCEIFTVCIVDPETSLNYSPRDCFKQRLICRLNDISHPLIVGIDEDNIWFISFSHDSNFVWFVDHV